MEERKKLKWCFLVSPYPLLMEFLGKLSRIILKEGDECILIVNGKIGEWSKLEFFPKELKVYSKVDWLKENYKESDEGLENFEWKDFFSDCDRWKLFRFNYSRAKKTVSQLYQFLDYVFQKEKPDLVLYGMVGSFLSQVAYKLCKRHGAKYVTLIRSRFPKRMDIFDSALTCSGYEKAFRELKFETIPDEEKNFAKEQADIFVNHKKITTYMNQQTDLNKSFASILNKYLKREKSMAKACFKYLLERDGYKEYDYESEIQFRYWFTYPLTFVQRNLKVFFLKRFYTKYYGSVDEKDKFFLYPLQQQPELSTSFLATYYNDQINTIRNIAFALPFGYKLYVKEHPVTFGVRSKEFYRQLKDLPNVVLIRPDENNVSLISKSEAVIILTSTIGMEAAMLGKRVYYFGEILYSYLPPCKKVVNFDDLREKIKEDLGKNNFTQDLEKNNILFMLSYLKNNIVCDFDLADKENDPNDYQMVYGEIKKRFGFSG